MIFQAGIDLEIKDRNVQAIIDLESGLIGFTERIANHSQEYYYQKAPKEFKMAFLGKIEGLCINNSHLNFKICRKEKLADQLIDWINENENT